jgi:rare lipoprotein A
MKAVRVATPVLSVVLAISVLLGADGNPVPPRPYEPETGVASWYGYPYHGQMSAGGEVYDMEKMTAAHPTLPFGTWVRVMNLRNERSVEVRITDRGPFVEGRVIDLSKAAARSVDMLDYGTATVRVEVISGPHDTTELPTDETPAAPPPPAVVTDAFAVQVGAFGSRLNAERLLAAMRARYGSGRIVEREGAPTLYRVMIGAEKTQQAAVALALRIRQDATQQTAFVARLDR